MVSSSEISNSNNDNYKNKLMLLLLRCIIIILLFVIYFSIGLITSWFFSIFNNQYLIIPTNIYSELLSIPSKLALSYYFFMTLLTSIFWMLIVLSLINEKKEGQDSSNTINLIDIAPKSTYSLLLITCITNLFIFSYRYIIYPVPQGFDTSRYYLYGLNYLKKDILYIFSKKMLLRPGLFFMLYLLGYVFNKNYEQTLFLTPLMLGLAFTWSVYCFLKKDFFKPTVAALLSVFSSFSFLLIRVSYDTIGNFLGLICLILFLNFYMHMYKKERLSYIDLLKLFAYLVVIATIYIWIIEFIALVIIVHHILMFIFLNKKNKHRLNIKIKFTKIIFIFFILFSLAVVIYLHINSWVFPFYLLTNNETPNDWWIVNREISLTLLFSIIGLVYVSRQKKLENLLLIAWVFSVSLLVIFTSFLLQYRLFILMPTWLLTPIGIYYVIAKIKVMFKRIKNIRTAKIVQVEIFLVIYLLMMTYTIPNAFIPEYVYRPDNETMNQIYWLSEHFGFSNENVIFLIYKSPAKPLEPKSSSNVYGWTRGYLGDSIYLGHVINLLQGKPDYKNHAFDITNRSVILADRLYHITNFELAITEKISDIGIYKLKTTNLTLLNDLLLSNANWSDNYFMGTWKLVDRSLYTQVYDNGTNLKLVFNSTAESGWFTIEYYYNPPYNTSEISTLILRVRGHLETIRMIIELYSGATAIRGVQYTELSENYTWILLELPSNYSLDRLRIAFNKLESGAGYEFVEFDYIVLI